MIKIKKSVILVSKTWQTVRLPLADIRITGRNTQGVILAKIKEGTDTFISATIAEQEDWDNQEDLNENN